MVTVFHTVVPTDNGNVIHPRNTLSVSFIHSYRTAIEEIYEKGAMVMVA